MTIPALIVLAVIVFLFATAVVHWKNAEHRLSCILERVNRNSQKLRNILAVFGQPISAGPGVNRETKQAIHKSMPDTTIDDLIAAVTEEETLVDGVGALFVGLKTKLDEALKGAAITPEVQAKINSVFETMKAQNKELADAIVANTPAET